MKEFFDGNDPVFTYGMDRVVVCLKWVNDTVWLFHFRFYFIVEQSQFESGTNELKAEREREDW